MRPIDVINAFGGYAKLAELAGIGRTGVFNWIRKGLPANRCLQLAELARKHSLDRPFRGEDGVAYPGLTLELLILVAKRPDQISPPKRRYRSARLSKSADNVT